MIKFFQNKTCSGNKNTPATETIVFYSFLFLNTLILFSNQYFVTLDGGSHNYNANIISELLFNDKSYYHKFYELNKELLPNSFSYCLFILFKKFFTFSFAEKALILIHLIYAVPVLSLSKMQWGGQDFWKWRNIFGTALTPPGSFLGVKLGWD